MSRFADLREKPWWSEADESELDLLTYEFVKCAAVHRERCGVCSKGGPWCSPLREALEGLLDWRAGRILRSKAAWLRARQSVREELVAA